MALLLAIRLTATDIVDRSCLVKAARSMHRSALREWGSSGCSEQQMAGKLDQKVAVVTVGGSDIGAATARRFAREAAAVVIADLSGTPPNRSR